MPHKTLLLTKGTILWECHDNGCMTMAFSDFTMFSIIQNDCSHRMTKWPIEVSSQCQLGVNTLKRLRHSLVIYCCTTNHSYTKRFKQIFISHSSVG